jgi:hypothetical protein
MVRRHSLSGRDGSLVTIYSFYKVVNTNIDQAGPSTVFAQQWQVLRTTEITSPNPRKQCITDLRTELESTRPNGSDIIIVGDFNEEIGREPGLMASVCASSNLYDVLGDLYPDQTSTPMYIHGRNHLDYALVSHTLRDQTTNTTSSTSQTTALASSILGTRHPSILQTPLPPTPDGTSIATLPWSINLLMLDTSTCLQQGCSTSFLPSFLTWTPWISLILSPTTSIPKLRTASYMETAPALGPKHINGQRSCTTLA